MEGKTMGNGSNTAYAEIRIMTCNGDTKIIAFKESAFRDSRTQANQVLGNLSVVAMSGSNVDRIKDPEGWFAHIPGWTHIRKLTLSKCNIESGKAKPITERTYVCEHQREMA